MYLRSSNSGTIKRSTANHQSLQFTAGQVEQGKREQDDLYVHNTIHSVNILFSIFYCFIQGVDFATTNELGCGSSYFTWRLSPSPLPFLRGTSYNARLDTSRTTYKKSVYRKEKKKLTIKTTPVALEFNPRSSVLRMLRSMSMSMRVVSV